LLSILNAVARDAESAVIDDVDYLLLLGVGSKARTAKEIWAELLQRVPEDRRAPRLWSALHQIHQGDTLSRRIRLALRGSGARHDVERIYGRLCDCLDSDEVFTP
jgi:hypothetical protein